MDRAQTIGAVLDAGCVGVVVGLAFRTQSRNLVASPSGLITECLDFARHDETTMRTAAALGSNIGNRFESLVAARNAISDLPNVRPPIISSALYETEPVGCEPAAAKFLNAVIEFDYEGDPTRLLERFIQIEEALGRKRDHPKNAPRTIDIDLLYCGNQRINQQLLQLPHPRIRVREFVLRPLADIRPDLILPGQKKTIRELLAEVEQPGEVIHFAEEW